VKATYDSLCQVETKEGCCVSVQTVLRQSNLKFRPEKPEIISIRLTLACSILKSLFRFNLTCCMS